jgi:hypothetical protein
VTDARLERAETLRNEGERERCSPGGVTPGVTESTARLRRLAPLVLVALAIGPWLASPVRAQTAAASEATFASRVDALALIQQLNTEILGSTSATLTLEKWCADRHLATPPVIVAKLVRGAGKAPTADQRARLGVSDDGAVRYRHVLLECGSLVLSEAENWYVPARLTADMNARLDTSDAPFGKVVQPLEPHRRTFAVNMLWTDAWPPSIPAALFEHRAILYTRDRQPFSEVDEVYQQALLGGR